MISKKNRENYKKCKQLFGGAVKEPVATSFPTSSMRRDTNKKKAAQLSESDKKKRKEIFGDTVKDLLTMKASVTSLHSSKNTKKLALAAGIQALVSTDDCIITTAAVDAIGVILNKEMEMADFVHFVGSYLVSTSSLKEYLNCDFLKTHRRRIAIALSPGSPGVEEPTSNVDNTKKKIPGIIRGSDDLTSNADNTETKIPGIIRASEDNVRVAQVGSPSAGYKKDIQAQETQPLPKTAKDLTDAELVWFLVVIFLSNTLFFELLGNILGEN
jgi:hypothetical protein